MKYLVRVVLNLSQTDTIWGVVYVKVWSVFGNTALFLRRKCLVIAGHSPVSTCHSRMFVPYFIFIIPFSLINIIVPGRHHMRRLKVVAELYWM